MVYFGKSVVAEVRIGARLVATDADEMDRTVLAAMCPHGAGCREGLNCPRGYTDAVVKSGRLALSNTQTRKGTRQHN